MPHIQIKRKSTRIDMTAMSDVTVLLLTFFMLTSTFIAKEPVMVATPASVSEIKIPETNVLQILVDKGGKVFLSLDKQDDRMAVLKSVGTDLGVTFDDREISRFRLLNSFGAPITQMKSFLALPTDQQDALLPTLGVPCDSINNEFKTWVQEARKQNPALRIAIKADQDTPYKEIKMIMNTLQKLRENRYHLITTLKQVPKEN